MIVKLNKSVINFKSNKATPGNDELTENKTEYDLCIRSTVCRIVLTSCLVKPNGKTLNQKPKSFRCAGWGSPLRETGNKVGVQSVNIFLLNIYSTALYHNKQYIGMLRSLSLTLLQ